MAKDALIRELWAAVNSAMGQVHPSAGQWFDVARNVVEFGSRDGTYDDLAKYMRGKGFR